MNDMKQHATAITTAQQHSETIKALESTIDTIMTPVLHAFIAHVDAEAKKAQPLTRLEALEHLLTVWPAGFHRSEARAYLYDTTRRMRQAS